MTDFTEIWSQQRLYLVDLAFRMLGNIQDAEDVVQEAFSRLLTQEIDTIDDVRGWLVVVVSRLCLDQLRSARNRRESRTAPLDDETRPSVVARNILRFFGPESGTTLVSHPVNGHPGVIAFRGGVLYGIVQLRTRDDLVHDLHAVADPQKLALLQLELEAATGA